MAFVLSGILTTFLGPALPSLQARYALDDAQSGSLFAAQFAGGTLATIAAGAVLARFGAAVAIGGGFALITVSLACLETGSLIVVRPALFFIGAGLGFSIPTTNLWMAGLVSGREKASVLNSINLAWGLGAALCPLVIKGSQMIATGLGPFLVTIGAFSLVVAAAALRLLPWGRIAPVASAARGAGVFSVVVPFAAFLFLYVGVETSVGGWAATYAQRDSGGPWFLASLLFWVGLLGGRALAAASHGRFDDRRVLRTGAFIATAAIAAWVLAPGAGMLVLVLIIGLGLAPLFPTAVAVFEARLGTAGMAASGPIFALSGIGGAVVPWLVGLASVRFGGLEAGLLVVLAASAGVLALTYRAFDATKA